MWAVFLFVLPVCLSMPLDQLDAFEYSDDLARNKLLALAASAYTNSPQTCVQNRINGTVKRQITVQCDPLKADTCSGFTAVSHSDKAIAVVYKGSGSDLQIIMEADESVFHHQVHFIGGGDVSEYFYKGFEQLWNKGMKDDFLQLHSAYPDYDIWVTGHSLGGSMAAIAAFYMQTIGIDANKIKLVTFGEPRAGNYDFAKAFDAALLHAYRVVHHNDIVPHLPFEFLGYYHHKHEVWYNNDMTNPTDYIVCDHDEDKKCSDSEKKITWDDHSVYFNVNLGVYTDKGCPKL